MPRHRSNAKNLPCGILAMIAFIGEKARSVLRSHVPKASKSQEPGPQRFIGPFGDRHHLLTACGVEDALDRYTERCSQGLECIEPVWRVFSIPNSLIREVCKREIAGHDPSFSASGVSFAIGTGACGRRPYSFNHESIWRLIS